MAIFSGIFIFCSVWISICSAINIQIYNFNNKNFKNQKIFLLLSLGFIFSFSIIGLLNIILHLFGLSVSFNVFLIVIPFLIVILNYSNINKFCSELFFSFFKFKKFFKVPSVNKNPFAFSLFFIIIIQTLCLAIRFLLPITHTDAIGQYFGDSLQISRLEGISINEFYRMGEGFRTDSLASFFDAFFIQITNSWILVRSAKVIALILLVFSSLEMAFCLGSFNFKKSLLLISLVLTLPDVWSVFISGKHDGYVCLFEFTGIYIIYLSIISKDNFLKLSFSFLSVLIGILSVSMRLSSLMFLLLALLLFCFYIFKSPVNLLKINLKKYSYITDPKNIILSILLIISSFIVCVFNIKYYSNPFYYLSPPGFIKNIFPDAISEVEYKYYKEILSLKNIPLIFKPISTFIYASLGLEPLRYILTKLIDEKNFFIFLLRPLDYFGPEYLLVSILSFSPFSLLPYFCFNKLEKNQKNCLILSTLLIFFWTLSVPYSRTAIAGSLSLVIIFLSNPNFFYNFSIKSFNGKLITFIYSYGLFSIYLFTFWSLSNMVDLPIKSLLDFENLNRTKLTRDYIEMQNKIYRNIPVIPSVEFEKQWSKIEKNNTDKLLFLKAPPVYAYFINKGLILKNDSNQPSLKGSQSLCFRINSEQIIKNDYC